MADFVLREKTIGTDSRDYTTIAAWEAAKVEAANSAEVGIVHADSVFDEKDVVIFGANVGALADMLRAAEGELPVMRPASGSASRILQASGFHPIAIVGITLDGVNLTSGVRNGFTQDVGGTVIRGCVVKNMAGNGIFGGATLPGHAIYCLSYGNTLAGYVQFRNNSTAVYCGAAKNGGDGFSSDGANGRAGGCWSLNNTGDDFSANWLTDFVYISDTSLSADDDIKISQDPATLGFTDFTNDDYSLAVGSVLRDKSWTMQSVSDTPQRPFHFAKHPQYGDRDAFGNKPGIQAGKRLNIGPWQTAAVVDTLPPEPTTAFVSIP